NIKPSTKKANTNTIIPRRKFEEALGSIVNVHPVLIVSYAIKVTTITATMQKILIKRPKPFGKRSEGSISDKILPRKTNNWFIVSANECIAVANIVPFPLTNATIIFTTATIRLPKAASPEERFPFLIKFIHFMLSLRYLHLSINFCIYRFSIHYFYLN